MKVLALDTASELCSAALWLDGELLARETLAPRAHAALILPMIDALLAEAGLTLAALDAIAFGRGPGAFTGVRLAAAIAQGLGFAAGRPLIPISDLRATAAQALLQVDAQEVQEVQGARGAPGAQVAQGAQGVLVCQDARMEEVYWGCFERRASSRRGAGTPPVVGSVGAEGVAPAAAVELALQWQSGSRIIGAGSGFAAYADLSRRLAERLALVLPELQPRAREIAWLAAEDGMAGAIAAEAALPVYLRDRVTATPAAPEPGSS